MSPERGFARALYQGVIEEQLLPYPELATREREPLERLQTGLRQLGATIDSALIDREGAIPVEVMDGLRSLGVFGLGIPAEHGGAGLSVAACTRATEALAAIDLSLAITVGTHRTLGAGGLVRFGRETQKRRHLPRLASGEWIAGFALTEPAGGSDVGSMKSRATFATDGEGYVLDGDKTWVTNGGIGQLFTVFARTSSEAPGASPPIAALLVERDFGVGVGAEHGTLGLHGMSTTTLHFENVRVPSTHVLGEVGKGFDLAMDLLSRGRLDLAAACLGSCKELLALAVGRCVERHAFGRPIGDLEMIRAKVARMMCRTYALESMTHLTASLVDVGTQDCAMEAAICKVFGADTLWDVADTSLQIAGGRGYMTDQPYERHLRDARACSILMGTNDVLRAFIALSGLRGPGDQLAELRRALHEPLSALGMLGGVAVQRVRGTFARERLEGVHSLLAEQQALFESSVTRLGGEVDRVLRKHGSRVAERQMVLERLANATIELYGLAAVLSRTTRALEARGEAGARREVDLCAGFAALAGRRLDALLDGVDRAEDPVLRNIATQAYDDGGYPAVLVR